MDELDRKITEPQFNEPFLSWYAGIFDQVYLAVHPFSTIEGVDPQNVQYQTTVLDRNKVDGPLTLKKYVQMSQAATASKTISKTDFAKLQKRQGKAISWKEICDGCGFEGGSDLNRVLMSQIEAIKDEFADPEGVEKLTAYCHERKIFFPTEDVIQPIMEPALARLVQALGIEKVCLSNEFNESKMNLKAKDLSTDDPWEIAHDLGFKQAKLYATDNTFLAVVPWDNFYTVLCGKGTSLKDAGVEELFEGFWCDSESRPEW